MICNSMVASSPSLAVLFLAALAGVQSFVLQPYGIASAAATRCGATSFVLRHKSPANALTGVGVHAAHSACSSVTTMMSEPSHGGELSRGAWAGRMLGAAAAGAVAVTQDPGFASAEVGVGEGGLPDGARQFSNLVKVQNDWIALGKSIKSQGDGVTDGEWKNVALFLRKVYQLGGDLEFLAGTLSSDKKKSALALVRNIQKEVQAADVPAREKNTGAFMTAQASVEKKFEEFMELFNDVPAEL
ncbi:unnamed protein product [Pylaiella littoralis]